MPMLPGKCTCPTMGRFSERPRSVDHFRDTARELSALRGRSAELTHNKRYNISFTTTKASGLQARVLVPIHFPECSMPLGADPCIFARSLGSSTDGKALGSTALSRRSTLTAGTSALILRAVCALLPDSGALCGIKFLYHACSM